MGHSERNSVVKNLIIVGSQVKKTLLERQDRLKLDQKGRVVTGFSIEWI